jgi:hypothetical protein
MNYLPRIKGKGFNPAPFAVQNGGIPSYADSISNPKVWGTAAHEDWWMEQIDICDNGYTTGGVFIPGRLYYYLNFCWLGTSGRGYHNPDYVDYDLEYAELVEEAKRTHKGIIGLKRRRAGFSEKWANMVGGYGIRFTPKGYKAGIVSGLSVYADGLGKKLINSNSLVAPELRLSIPNQGSDIQIFWRDPNDQKIKKGSLGEITVRTANTNSSVMKGERYDDVAFEEAGEFDLLEDTYGKTKSAFQVGDLMIGTPYVYGTGGNAAKGSKAFRRMWNEPDIYNLLKTEAYVGRLRNNFYVGSTNFKGKVEYDCPNILELQIKHDLSYEQVLGCEDINRVYELKNIHRAKLLKGASKLPYYEELQTDPFNEKECFLKLNQNNYPIEHIAEAELRIYTTSPKRYSCYSPDWKRNQDGSVKMPLEVDLGPQIHPTTHVGEYVMILDDAHSWRNIKGLFYKGTDSYDIDKTQTSKSLGASVVVTRDNNYPYIPSRMPVCVIQCRPPRKEKFYSLSGMMAIYFDCLASDMIDARMPAIISWYENNGLRKYLAPRPESVESMKAEQIHDYGYKKTTFSIPVGVGKIQSWCLDQSQYCWFEMLLADIRDYDETEAGTDWDLHDALECALIGMDDKQKVITKNNVTYVDPFAVNVVSFNGQNHGMGQHGPKPSTKARSEVHDPFGSW